MKTSSDIHISTTAGIFNRLCEVSASLLNLRRLAECEGNRAKFLSHEFCPEQMRTLCEVIDKGRDKIKRRIAELGEARIAVNGELEVKRPLREDSQDPLTFLRAYRACSRRICATLREAFRMSDAATSAALMELTMRLEKQLWLIDGQKRCSGAEEFRSVLLFLEC